MGRFIDLAGKKFGRLTAYSYAHVQLSTGRMMPAWLCICDCGNKKVVQGHHLRGGKTQSCGCAMLEPKRPGGQLKNWPGYGRWWQMIQRCRNPNVIGYKDYGGRGIKVCDRWLHGEDGVHPFECFLADMGDSNGLTIDRIDVNGNYEPGNCRWATDAQQRTNTRRSVHAVIGGVKVPLNRYAARLGLSYEGMRIKVKKHGMLATEAARYLRDYWRTHRRAA